MSEVGANELRHRALVLLLECDPRRKAAGCIELAAARQAGEVALDASTVLDEPAAIPGRPAGLQLVHPRDVARRGLGSREGRIALYHSLCHIEFNAINLALDAVWRFERLPVNFYDDWLRVAGDESRHFGWLAARLELLGSHYGALPAHDGLWEAAEKTRDDLLDRMTLVPRTLEARGLDVTPAMRERLAAAGDAEGARLLDSILADEIEHVRIGNHWYRWCCERAGRDPLTAHRTIATAHGAAMPRGPFNLDARRRAGFSDAELLALDVS
ncbi:ferritin-like domain-containing protein [soil metagenome]